MEQGGAREVGVSVRWRTLRASGQVGVVRRGSERRSSSRSASAEIRTVRARECGKMARREMPSREAKGKSGRSERTIQTKPEQKGKTLKSWRCASRSLPT